MPLLEIRQVRKLTALCTLEESTAKQVDQYAAFAQASADEVVNKAIEYAFGKDAEFQKYCSSNPKVPAALRVKKPATAPAAARTRRTAANAAAAE